MWSFGSRDFQLPILAYQMSNSDAMSAPRGLARRFYNNASVEDIPETLLRNNSPPNSMARHLEKTSAWRRRRRRCREDGVFLVLLAGWKLRGSEIR